MLTVNIDGLLNDSFIIDVLWGFSFLKNLQQVSEYLIVKGITLSLKESLDLTFFLRLTAFLAVKPRNKMDNYVKCLPTVFERG